MVRPWPLAEASIPLSEGSASWLNATLPPFKVKVLLRRENSQMQMGRCGKDQRVSVSMVLENARTKERCFPPPTPQTIPFEEQTIQTTQTVFVSSVELSRDREGGEECSLSICKHYLHL